MSVLPEAYLFTSSHSVFVFVTHQFPVSLHLIHLLSLILYLIPFSFLLSSFLSFFPLPVFDLLLDHRHHTYTPTLLFFIVLSSYVNSFFLHILFFSSSSFCFIFSLFSTLFFPALSSLFLPSLFIYVLPFPDPLHFLSHVCSFPFFSYGSTIFFFFSSISFSIILISLSSCFILFYLYSLSLIRIFSHIVPSSSSFPSFLPSSNSSAASSAVYYYHSFLESVSRRERERQELGTERKRRRWGGWVAEAADREVNKYAVGA